MQNAYASLNRALITHWATVAPGVAIVFGDPTPPTMLPPACLRVYWESYGDPTGQPDERAARVDLAIFTPPNNGIADMGTALKHASALDIALGFADGQGAGRLGRYDWTIPVSPVYLNEMTLAPEHGWVEIPTNSPGQIWLARTALLTFRLLSPIGITNLTPPY